MACAVDFTIWTFESEFCSEPTAYPYGTHSLLVVVPLGQRERMIERLGEWQLQAVFERMEPHGGVC
jgi:hypothetical protein